MYAGFLSSFCFNFVMFCMCAIVCVGCDLLFVHPNLISSSHFAWPTIARSVVLFFISYVVVCCPQYVVSNLYEEMTPEILEKTKAAHAKAARRLAVAWFRETFKRSPHAEELSKPKHDKRVKSLQLHHPVLGEAVQSDEMTWTIKILCEQATVGRFRATQAVRVSGNSKNYIFRVSSCLLTRLCLEHPHSQTTRCS